MNDTKDLAIRKIAEVIERDSRFLVATHVRPDGDAVGSLLGMTFILRKLGKEADPYCQDPVPSAYAFLPGSGEILHHLDSPSRYDTAIFVDCGSYLRVGNGLADSIRGIPTLINIDHHVSKAPFGNPFWVTPAVSSTCEMLYHLSRDLRLPLDADIASQLYTGLLTDTGSFRFSNTSRSVLQIAAELVAAGARPADIAEHVYESASPQSMQLLARMLATIAFAADNRLATAELSQRMFKETATTPVDSEGFINHLRSVEPVELAMLFREDDNGKVHVSMRSKGNVDVAAFAQRYDGGGHRRAAAFHVSGDLQKMRGEFTQQALNYLLGA